jgi:uncharacterized protein (TIGR00156 family)
MNKKTIIFFIALLFTTNAYTSPYEYSQKENSGGFDGPRVFQGGFDGPGAILKLITVKSAKGMRDDARVTLEGYLINQIREEYYTFKDDTGEIVVEIDYKHFGDTIVTPRTKIRVTGEVDKEWNKIYIDVYYLEVIK